MAITLLELEPEEGAFQAMQQERLEWSEPDDLGGCVLNTPLQMASLIVSQLPPTEDKSGGGEA